MNWLSWFLGIVMAGIRRTVRGTLAIFIFASLILPPGGLVLGQEAGKRGSGDGNLGERELARALAAGKAGEEAVAKIPKAREFLRGDAAGVKAHGGRISLRKLDLKRVPGEKELRQAGQLGSPLSPSKEAEPGSIKDATKRKKQEADNLLFGQAMEEWNAHHYPEAVKLLRQHRQKHGDSAWAGEAELHLGCQAQFSGSWEEAKFSFESILNSQPKGSDIWQKAKLRRAVLHMDQGELEAAQTAFRELLETEKDWERRTYATHWLQQLSLLQKHEVALRDCGAESIAYVLRGRGEAERAEAARRKLAPTAKGFSLGELSEFAHGAGLGEATAVRLGFESLDEMRGPFVAHYTDRHFVVVSGTTADGALRVYDPRLKHETELSREQFAEQWSGLSLIFGEVPVGGRLASQKELEENYGGCCGLPRSESNLGPQDDSTLSCGLPVWQVNPVNMNLVVEDTPMWFDEAVGPDVMLRITYNSQDALNQFRPFGSKWTFDYTSYAMESPAQGGSGTVLVVMPGGRRDSYQPIAGGGYTAPAGVFNKLSKIAGEPYGFKLEKPDGTVYRYGVPAGMNGTSSLLLSITDRYGVALNMVYTADGQISTIKDARNRAWTFLYNTQGYVSRIDDPFGRNATFSYDGTGNLIGQTDMGGLSYGYTYDSNVYLTSVIKPTGTWQFYIEPADGIVNSGPDLGYADYKYPPFGGVMWQNYRITITDPLHQKEEYYYDGYHHTSWYRDKIQNDPALPPFKAPKTSYEFTVVGGQGVITTVTFADGTNILRSNFNSQRLPQSVRDERGYSTTLTYNSQGRVLTSKDALNHTTTYQYAANGTDLATVINAAAVTVLQLAYDANRNVTTVTDALNRVTGVTYNAFGQPATVTTAQGSTLARTRTFNYDGDHLLTSITQSGQTLGSLTYDAFDRAATRTDTDGFTIGLTYDNLNRPVRVTYPDGTFTETQWGCCTIERQTDRARRSTRYIHDALSRLVIQRDAAQRMIIFEHDAVGNLRRLLDGNRNITRWEYDARYRVTKKTYADSSFSSLKYDYAGNLSEQTDALGVKTSFIYDEVNNLTRVAPTGLTAVNFTYDTLNRRAQMTDGIGTTVFGYNLASQLTSVDGPWANDTITFGYDALRRTTGQAINGVAASANYDAFDRVTSAVNPLGTFTYSYTGPVSGELAAVVFPNGQTSALNYLGNVGDRRLQQLWHKDAGGNTLSKFGYEYNTLGEITKWTQQAGVNAAQAQEFGYDAVGELTSALMKDAVAGTVQKSYSYRYDAAGNRLGEAIDTLVSQETPNALNQLKTRQAGAGVLPIRGQVNEPVKSVTVNGTPAKVSGQSFEGSASVTAGQNTITVVATDTNDNVTTKEYQVTVTGSGSRTLNYDAKGNLLDDGVKTYEWDVLNRLVAINYTGSNPARRTEFTYNGLSQRVKIVEKTGTTVTSEKRFVWAPGAAQPSEERDASNTVIKRYYGQGMQVTSGATTGSYYYTRDHLGSIRELTDAAGALRARYAYDPYGRRTANQITTNAVEADFAFTGHYFHNPSSLPRALFRAYDPELGRWLSRDPIGERGGMNLHGYVHNRPVQFRDPRGLQVEEDITEEMVEHEIRMIANLIRRVAGMSELNEANEEEPFRIEISRRAFDEWKNDKPAERPAPTSCPVHGNSLLSPKPTTLYSLYDRETGEFLKYGITSEPNIEDRYPSSFLEGKFMLEEMTGSRYEMRQFEMQLYDINPGPMNFRR